MESLLFICQFSICHPNWTLDLTQIRVLRNKNLTSHDFSVFEPSSNSLVSLIRRINWYAFHHLVLFPDNRFWVLCPFDIMSIWRFEVPHYCYPGLADEQGTSVWMTKPPLSTLIPSSSNILTSSNSCSSIRWQSKNLQFKIYKENWKWNFSLKYMWLWLSSINGKKCQKISNGK
jgi:hypothetical protein